MSENEMNVQTLYSHPYYAMDGKLYIEKQSRSGPYLEQLCNFTPRIVSEVTFDDGQTVRKEYRIGGEDEYGNPLPEVDVAADELPKMEWLANHFPATLRLSVVSSVEKHVQCAMKETAVYAEQKYVFAHTGWKEINGKFHYLLPGCGEHEVRLCGKQKAYCGADDCKQEEHTLSSGRWSQQARDASEEKRGERYSRRYLKKRVIALWCFRISHYRHIAKFQMGVKLLCILTGR